MSTPPGGRLRIAFVLGEFPSVSETFVYEQIAGLRTLGHDVEVLAERQGVLPEARAEQAGVAVRYLFTPPRRTPGPDGRGLPATLPRHRGILAGLPLELSIPRHLIAWRAPRAYDIIHAHFGPYGLKAAVLRRYGVLRGKLVTTFHAYDISGHPLAKRPGRYRRLQAAGDLFLAVSEHGRSRLEALGFPPERIVIHPMGIDLGRFRFAPRTPPTAGTIRLLTVARLVEKKGVEYALRAVAALAHGGTRLHYEIVGDGPLAPDLRRLAAQLGIEDVVSFRGALAHADVAAPLQCAHVFVLPSVTATRGNEEGVPVALMEAMAVGLPGVAMRHAGNPELIADGVSGMLVGERDVAGLAAALRHLIESPQTCAAMGLAARARVEHWHDSARLNARLVNLYRELLQRKEVR